MKKTYCCRVEERLAKFALFEMLVVIHIHRCKEDLECYFVS